MNKDKWYLEPIWHDHYMALKVDGHARGFEISRQFGDAKRLYPHSSVMTGIDSTQIQRVEMRLTTEEPQVILYVTYGKGEFTLGDVQIESVSDMERWVTDVNALISDVRSRRENTNTSSLGEGT